MAKYLPPLPAELQARLETPCIVIDKAQTERNIARMQSAVTNAGCALRPHIKTHKIGRFGQMQIQAGATGITCAKVSEAEVMAAAGIDDIFIAYPLVGAFRLHRAVKLLKKVKRLILGVDSIAGAQALNAEASDMGVRFEVRLEIDTGAKRTGVAYEDALETARYISTCKQLDLTGIYTFKSLVYQGKSTVSAESSGLEEAELMASAARSLRDDGIPIADISAGSTPTGLQVAKTGLVTEVRPGTYIFNDYMLYKEGAAELEDIAGFFYVTVVSVPGKEYAVIDGGTKTFPMDIFLNASPYYYPSYAMVDGRDDLVLTRLNEEHGMLTSLTGDIGLKTGQILRLIPIHICTAINLQNQIYLFAEGNLETLKVEARGMLA
ncbi:MAG: alanine racemase [Spirochaetaceae bacterium]|jgi:D-serine deaminase-like pyridoxal phosphate-dependent protein|nr:alanine racemase [Spirochaetaceae bacterium]